MNSIPNHITLNTGRDMPVLGLGVYKITDAKEVDLAVKSALNAGYRLIDTASVYKNEDSVGKAVKSSSVPREEIFVTTKVWNTAQRLGDISGAFERSLQRLKLDYVDLYMMHWPVKGCFVNTWKEMEKIYHSGKAKAIGVSNFTTHHLEELLVSAEVVPAVNQIEYHPLMFQGELAEYCLARDIIPQAYSPLARGMYLSREVMIQIGRKYGKSPAQVGLRWIIQRGLSVIPKSTSAQRIQENAQIFDFELTREELMLIDALHENYRVSSEPESTLY